MIDLVERLRRLGTRIGSRPASPPPYFWSGVYPDFASVPLAGPGFGGVDWVEQTAALTRSVRDGDTAAAPRDGGLMALAVTALARNGRPVRILDFGGGMGVDYFYLRHVLGNRSMVARYVVLEQQSLSAAGRSLFGGEPALEYADSVEGAGDVFDLVQLSASLQYVNNWRAVLRRLLDLHPVFLLLSNTFSGAFPTFATAQTNHPGSIIPCWFFNRSELESVCSAAGWELATDIETGPLYDQTNLPEDRRPGRARNLVFMSAPHAQRE